MGFALRNGRGMSQRAALTFVGEAFQRKAHKGWPTEGRQVADNNSYYRQRMEEELVAADRSSDPSIALIHRELARRYRDILDTRLQLVPTPTNGHAKVGGFNGA